MANNCSNVLTLGHSDLSMIQRAVTAFTGNGLLQEFCPVPQELKEASIETSKSAVVKQLQAVCFKQFGYYNENEWRLAEWGTKSDIIDEVTQEIAITDVDGLHSVKFTFDTAWSPPIEAYRKLTDLGFAVQGLYYEPGNAFCGEYTSADDDNLIEMEGDSVWVRHHVPHHIEQAFSIVQFMKEWEDEENFFDDDDEPHGIRRMRNYDD